MISSYAIIGKLVRDFGEREDEGTLIEWIGEAIELIGVNESWCQKTTDLINLSNFQCRIPIHCRNIIQIVKNNSYSTPELSDNNASINVISVTTDDPVPIDELGRPLTGYDVAWYRPYFDLVYEYQFWYKSPGVRDQSKFGIVQKSGESFFDSQVYKETADYQGSVYQYNLNNPEYAIIEAAKMLRFSFEKGQIFISYLKQITDVNGFPMIPDEQSYAEALVSYIMYRRTKKDYFKHGQGSENRLVTAKDDWLAYCSQAKNYSFMPKSVDDMEKLKRNNGLVHRNRYKQFFK